MSDILPTGTCFDDALEYLAERVQENPRVAQQHVRLAHAICRGNLEGKLYVHAWVEDADLCFDFGLLEGQRVVWSATKEEYYKMRDIVDVTLYTPRQAAEENRRTRTYGPWKSQYLALCRRAGDPIGIVGKERIEPPEEHKVDG